MRIVCVSVIQGNKEGELVLRLPDGHEKMSPVELALNVALDELHGKLQFMEENESQMPKSLLTEWAKIRQDMQEAMELIGKVLEGVNAQNRVNLRLNESERRRVMHILLSTFEAFSYQVKSVDDLKKLIEIARVFVEALS